MMKTVLFALALALAMPIGAQTLDYATLCGATEGTGDNNDFCTLWAQRNYQGMRNALSISIRICANGLFGACAPFNKAMDAATTGQQPSKGVDAPAALAVDAWPEGLPTASRHRSSARCHANPAFAKTRLERATERPTTWTLGNRPAAHRSGEARGAIGGRRLGAAKRTH